MNTLLTFPDPLGMSLSIRAKALLFHDPRSSELLQQVERIARLGSRKPISLDVRLIAATNVDLHKAIAARFRQNQVQTARALGVSRNILRAHLKRQGLIGSLQPSAGGEDGETGAIAAVNRTLRQEPEIRSFLGNVRHGVIRYPR